MIYDINNNNDNHKQTTGQAVCSKGELPWAVKGRLPFELSATLVQHIVCSLRNDRGTTDSVLCVVCCVVCCAIKHEAVCMEHWMIQSIAGKSRPRAAASWPLGATAHIINKR